MHTIHALYVVGSYDGSEEVQSRHLLLEHSILFQIENEKDTFFIRSILEIHLFGSQRPLIGGVLRTVDYTWRKRASWKFIDLVLNEFELCLAGPTRN
jgi:hypothetical protein